MPLLRCASLVLLLLAASVSPLAAQSGSIRGQVVDDVDLRPIAGAQVRIGTDGPSTLTNADGRFGFDGLPVGVVTVRVQALGYSAVLVTDVVLQASRSSFVQVRLPRQAVEVEGVVVDAPAFRVPDAAPTSLQLLANEELRRTPGGLLDVSRTLRSLPGVLGGLDNRNDLLVRGGGPGENAYYLDGIRIPQINHFATQGASGGALGLVNVDFIREVEFYTGAFPVEFGDALSSVLSIDNRPGTREGIRGDFTLGATEAGLTLDGPAGERANWLFSVRRSYLQFLFKALGLPIRPDYWDGQFRVEVEPTPRDRILLVGLGAVDDFDIVPPGPDDSFENQEIAQSVIDNDQRSFTVGASWRRLVPGGYVTATASRSASDFTFADVGADGEAVLTNESLEQSTRLGLRADLAATDGLRLVLGTEAERATLDASLFQRSLPGGSFQGPLAWNEEVATWKLAAFAQTTLSPTPRLSLTAGVRVDEVSALDDGLALSPRGSARLELGNGVSAQVAAGVFHQSPALLWLSVRDRGAAVNRSLRQQRNRQVAGGLSWLPNPGLRLSVEGFVKEYDRVPLLAGDPRITVSNLGGDYGFVGAEPLRDDGTGLARGVELFAQQKLLERVYLLGAYTLSWSEFAGANGVLRPSAWDRRHALDLTAGYRLGDAWELGTRVRVLSGLATTPVDLETSAEAYALTGRGVFDWDRLGSQRTPTYVGWDVRAERRISFDRWNAVVFLDLQNVINRANILGYAYTEDPAFPDRIRPIDGAGLLPTFGFSIEF